MRSRMLVGDILKTSSAKVTIFWAAVILGQGGGSFQISCGEASHHGVSKVGSDQITTYSNRRSSKLFVSTERSSKLLIKAIDGSYGR